MVFLLVSALKCHQCLSTISWSDCKSKEISVTCAPDFNRCAKIYAEGNISEGFGKGCESSSNCKTYCPNALIRKCQITCCSGDMCNGAATQRIGVKTISSGDKYNGAATLTSGVITIAVALLVALANLS